MSRWLDLIVYGSGVWALVLVPAAVAVLATGSEIPPAIYLLGQVMFVLTAWFIVRLLARDEGE